MTFEDKANNIFLEFYSKLVVIDELYEAVVIKDLAKDVAILHVILTKDDNAKEIIHHIKKIK